MRPGTVLVAVVGVVAAACSAPESSGESTVPADPLEVTGSSGGATPPATDPPDRAPIALDPGSVTTLQVVGPEEVVFDWSSDQCEPEHLPDIAPRAFRTADGMVNLTIGHWSTYRMVGATLDDLDSDCSAPLFTSDYNADPAAFDDSEWLAAVYTVDGVTYHGIVHNEYRGDTHTAARPGQCPSGQRLPCLDTSITQVVSSDGGRTFRHVAPAPAHLVATLPYTYRDDTVPTGIRQPSNIIDGRDGYWYLFGNVSDQPDQRQWVCAMRTDNLADPRAWRYWDGDSFDGIWGNPYTDPTLSPDQKCAPLAPGALGDAVNEGVVFDEAIGRFVMVGAATDPIGPAPRWGIYVSTSTDLVHWTTRQLLIEVPITSTVADPAADLMYAYPTLIDPDSESPNFETSDGRMYLYMSRFNAGGGSYDRDVVRWPVEFVEQPSAQPDWTFDDPAHPGWVVDNDLAPATVAAGTLTTVTTGADPWLVSERVHVAAVPAQLVVRMRVSGTGGQTTGQVFWSVDGDSTFVESRAVLFTVQRDGQWHDYVIDLSTSTEWDGTVTGLRLDPAEGEGLTVEIDRIVLAELSNPG